MRRSKSAQLLEQREGLENENRRTNFKLLFVCGIMNLSNFAIQMPL